MNKISQIVIIEHLEPELWPWCIIEYKNISKIIGKENLWFTNIKSHKEKLNGLGKIFEKSVIEFNLKNACVLDPNAKQTLKPNETKNFDYFIIGGILGDYPPKKRTKVELTKKLNSKARNMGKGQLSTDNAVYVLNEIIMGEKLESLKFQDGFSLKINKVESIDLPYFYPLINGKPRISKDIIKYLKNKKDF